MTGQAPGFLFQLATIFYLILPLYMLILVGYTLRKSGLVVGSQREAFSRLNFYGAAPAIIFFKVSTSDLSALWTSSLLLHLVIALFLFTTALYILGRMLNLEPSKQGVFVQGSFRSNMFYIGIPVSDLVFGSGTLGFAFIVLAVMMPLYNLISVVALSLPHQESGLDRKKIWNLSKNIFSNPLILSAVIGILVKLLEVPVPEFIMKSTAMLGKISLPLALVEVGNSLSLSSIRRVSPLSWLALSMKLIFVPLAYLLFLYNLGNSGPELKTVIILMAAPTAMLSFIMAKNMQGDETMATHLVVVSSFLSMLSLPLWVYFLNLFLG